ncbi:MAG: ATP-binding protein, partial [Ruminococcus sp.]|nr:ATP-binding protein [Ruminococcus sp.]
MSGTALSQIKNGKYKANPQKIFDTLKQYFGVKEKAKFTYSEVGYAPTSISEQIYDIISVCQVKGGLAVACGDSGIGKTKAAQKFVSDNPSNSFLITINPCLTNVKSLLKTIADRIGAGQEKSVNELWFSIANKLSDGAILIFDEAQHLTVKTIEVLRSFSDYFNDKGQTLGICFIGNVETITRMGGKKAEFAQIANRTKQR